jgi:hypothetical protein
MIVLKVSAPSAEPASIVTRSSVAILGGTDHFYAMADDAAN